MAKFETWEDIFNFTKSAFETGHVTDLISGKGNYAIQTSKYDSVTVPNDIPTDFEYILRVCIYSYYKESKDPAIPEKFKDALIQMLNSKDAKTVWCAYTMLWFQCLKEAKGTALFSIIDNDLITITHNALLANKSNLEKCFIWAGKKRTNGLWGDIEKSNAFLCNKYGRNFL